MLSLAVAVCTLWTMKSYWSKVRSNGFSSPLQLFLVLFPVLLHEVVQLMYIERLPVGSPGVTKLDHEGSAVRPSVRSADARHFLEEHQPPVQCAEASCLGSVQSSSAKKRKLFGNASY